MTYYQEQIIRIKNEVYPREYLYLQVRKAKQYIESHFPENPDLDKMAGVAYFSKFHFIRLFKSIYGKTPYQYLVSVRIEKAKQLLRTGTKISDVCFSVGFGSLSSFKELFKRYTSSTPASYKNKWNKEKKYY
ncbi:MAG: AraC family transcriptional regulator [Chitinophagaceae bacterium]|nr:MAG: AraC family transcriptional regulator [Chitinophagaceae bacterium]